MNTQHFAVLRQLFADNRAEWPSPHFQDIFVRPTYLTKLESLRPCILVGGRGTGKTTSLQSLKYNTTLERLESCGMTFGDQEYLGILVRMNKNRVRAFRGGNVSDRQWEKVFAHYFNLLACQEFCGLAKWLELMSKSQIPSEHVTRVATELGLDPCESMIVLQNAIKKQISALQLYVNNPSIDSIPFLSIAESPLKTFAEILTDSGASGDRFIFCCIDEYENLLDYQQAVLNTYVKHAEHPLTYKIGVRKNGLRNRQTSDGQDLLRTPDDYAEIEIAEEGFEYFARAVAELRLKCAREYDQNVPTKLTEFLEDLTFPQEAILLGADKVADDVLEALARSDKKLHKEFSNRPKHEVYFLKYWHEGGNGSIEALARDWLENEDAWATRLGNYGYASLFWLSKGKKGARIRKYYCGERVFLALPAGNIRFFLELIDAAIGHQLNNHPDDYADTFSISPKAQTLAVRDVGRRRLDQLEGLADHGVQLKRLVLAIGKVFFELARSPIGRAPEATSFVLKGTTDEINEIIELLIEGVGHLAFETAPRTKATSMFEMRDDEFRLHRIFCGFFEISHRKKRRITFNARDLLGVLKDTPARAISSLLDGCNQTDEEELPEQLAFFNAFYDPSVQK